MKTIILCGGLGARLREETEFKPKPMIKIGQMPILWHIMKIYAHYGFNDFVLTLGYKGHLIREHFSNNKEFNINFSETGAKSQTGKRLLIARKHITEEEFMVTYGDGVANINIKNLLQFHRKQGTIGTLTGVHPYAKYGLVAIDTKSNLITAFDQKPLLHDYVNGGFMVFKKKAFDYFDESEMENGLKKMAAEQQLSVYPHEKFWKPMDTYREMEEMNKLWKDKKPWAVWLTKK